MKTMAHTNDDNQELKHPIYRKLCYKEIYVKVDKDVTFACLNTDKKGNYKKGEHCIDTAPLSNMSHLESDVGLYRTCAEQEFINAFNKANK